jgi:hypothetical protein
MFEIPESLFETVIDAFAGRPGVSVPGQSVGSGFGAGALKVNRSIFAMPGRGELRGRLVVKLPSERVFELIEAGQGEAFQAGKGTRMKQWLVVHGSDPTTWLLLAEEAFAFVASGDGAVVVWRPRHWR